MGTAYAHFAQAWGFLGFPPSLNVSLRKLFLDRRKGIDGLADTGSVLLLDQDSLTAILHSGYAASIARLAVFVELAHSSLGAAPPDIQSE